MMAKRNYKVYADLGYRHQFMVRKLSILDTGAGPNVIRKSELPTELLNHLEFGPVPNVADANRNPIRILGIIRLLVRLGSHLSKVPFLVAEKLAAPVILGADFCDRYVEAIRPRKRVVELDDGSTVPIVRRPAKRPSNGPPLPSQQEYEPLKGKVSPKVKSAESMTIAPGTQRWVDVTTLWGRAHTGRYFVQTLVQGWLGKLAAPNHGFI